MSEPVTTPDPSQATPVVPATPVIPDPQPVPTEPVDEVKKLKEELNQSEARAKRYKEQLAGKDQYIEKLKVQRIVSNYTPTEDVIPPIDSEPATPLKTTVVHTAGVQQSLYINHLMMKDKFANDPDLPYTEEVKREVENVLEELDPTHRIKQSPEAWETGYNIVRGKKAGDIAKSREERVRQELQDKLATKVTATVEPATPPAPIISGPTLNDVLTGKVKMSAADILKNFPEARKGVSKRVLKEYGYIE